MEKKNLFQFHMLTLKALITTAADDIPKYFFIVFSEKLRLDVSCESSARQRIHMKHQALFFSKDKSKKLKCRLLQFLFSALRVKENYLMMIQFLRVFSFDWFNSNIITNV